MLWESEGPIQPDLAKGGEAGELDGAALALSVVRILRDCNGRG